MRNRCLVIVTVLCLACSACSGVDKRIVSSVKTLNKNTKTLAETTEILLARQKIMMEALTEKGIKVELPPYPQGSKGKPRSEANIRALVKVNTALAAKLEEWAVKNSK